jgi:hypothetical protein
LAIAQVVEHVLQLVHVAHLWGRGAVVSTRMQGRSSVAIRSSGGHVAHLPPEPFVPLDAPARLGTPV